MPDREATVTNWFETTLASALNATALVATVVDTGALVSPCYLIVEPDSPTQREVIYFDGTITSTQLNTTSLVNRYLAGSAQTSGLNHPIGSVVRMAPLAQNIEDLHDRIDVQTAALAVVDGDLTTAEGNIASLLSDVADHEIRISTAEDRQQFAYIQPLEDQQANTAGVWKRLDDVGFWGFADPISTSLSPAAAGDILLTITGTLKHQNANGVVRLGVGGAATPPDVDYSLGHISVGDEPAQSFSFPQRGSLTFRQFISAPTTWYLWGFTSGTGDGFIGRPGLYVQKVS